MTARARFVVTFTPVPGVDGIRALRAVLKTALRRHGLRAADVREESAPTPDISTASLTTAIGERGNIIRRNR
jgi:hypothetical protein